MHNNGGKNLHQVSTSVEDFLESQTQVWKIELALFCGMLIAGALLKKLGYDRSESTGKTPEISYEKLK